MEQTKIVSQIYGYAVCLVAVITFLISSTSLINSVIDFSDPIHSGYGSSNLVSYEIYKTETLKSTNVDPAKSQAVYVA